MDIPLAVTATSATIPGDSPGSSGGESLPGVGEAPLPPVGFAEPVFATGQSVRPGEGRGRTTFRRPVPSFPKLARQVRTKDQDGRHCVVPSSHFLNLPDK